MSDRDVAAELDAMRQRQERADQDIDDFVQLIEGILERIDDSGVASLARQAYPMTAFQAEAGQILNRIKSRRAQQG